MAVDAFTDAGRGFLHVSNVFLFLLPPSWMTEKAHIS